MSGDGVINPDNIVIPDADPDAIEAAGKALKDDAADIAQAGHDIKRAWAGLEGNYIAPESEELLAAVDPVADDGDEMEDKITTVGQALIDFAEEIRPLLARWKSLKADAETLAADIRETGEEWTKDEDKVDQHNQLNNDLAAVLTEYQEAERNCANAITALVEGGTRFIAANLDGSTVAGDGEVVYGLSEAPEDVATPWATPQEYDAPWWVDVGSALWDIGAGTVTDFASLLGLYHEERGWGVSSWDEWKNNIADYVSDNLAGVAYLTGFYTENGWGVDSAAQWWENFSGAWTEVGHSLVPWREWDTRPGYVITTGVINIGSIVAGVALSATGVGASVGVPLLAWRGARVLRTLSNLGDVVPNSVLRRLAPASHLHNLLHGRSPDDVTTDLGDSVDSLSLPSSHLDELDEALANADDFGSQPDRGALSPSGGTPELPASTDPRSTTPDSEAPAPSATGSADDAPRPAEGGQSSHPDRPSSQDSPAEEAAGTEDPAPAASPTDRPGTDREASPSEDSADSSTGNRTPASEERLATTGEIEEILDLLHSYVDTPDDLLRLIEASRDTELNADLPERDLVTANAGNGPGTGGASSDLSLNAHHDTPGTRGGSAGGPFDLPGTGTSDRGTGLSVDGNGSSGSHSRSGALDLGGTGSGRSPSGGGGSGSGDSDLPPPVRIDADSPLAPEPGKLFGRDGGLAPNTRYEVVDSSGNPRGTYITDADGNIDRIRIDRNSPLAPPDNQRFEPDWPLDPDARYEIFNTEGKKLGDYLTDSDGNIREIRVDTTTREWVDTSLRTPKAKHPEFLSPRPDMTYVVDGYKYQTDSLGRTVSVEGTLHNGSNVRNSSEQSVVNQMGKKYYELLNEKIRENFFEKNGRYPEKGEVKQYATVRWDGGHLIGSQEFFGTGERLNMVPMRSDVNQNRRQITALPDKQGGIRDSIGWSFRNIEQVWQSLLNEKLNSEYIGKKIMTTELGKMP